MSERKDQLEDSRALHLLDRHWKWVTLAAWAILCAWFTYNRWGQIQAFTLVDTDDNMRISQVRALLAGQDWFDLRQYRLNPPFGADIHWSRLVDLPLAGLILLLLAPRAADAVARTAKTKALVSFGVGFAAFFLIPIIAFATLFTVVGIPLGIILLLLVIGFVMGQVVSPEEVLGRDVLFAGVSVSVGIILFEGSLSLRFRDLRGLGTAVVRLCTVVVAIAWVLITASGMVAGIGINTAHELGHKKESHERWLSKIALAQSFYGHFYIEHNRGHHVRVATPEDPASSRLGESFWAFWPRTVSGSLKSGWGVEAKRYRRKDTHPFHLGNDVLNAWLMSAVLYGGMLALYGWEIAPYALITIVFCIALTSQPVRMNSVASQSSRPGWLGHSPCVPKSSLVLTNPTPK